MLMNQEPVNRYWRVREGKRRAKDKRMGYSDPWVKSPSTNFTKFKMEYEDIKLKWWQPISFSKSRKVFKRIGHRSARCYYRNIARNYTTFSEEDACDDAVFLLPEKYFSDKFFDFDWLFW